ncbi:helix-turn-helix domain-containing protein [Draconibacterium sp.]|nr:helix-turn-helix domain-containing protein [Draconibacterium sp.]
MNLLSNSFPLRILNIEKTFLDCSWNYKNVCSPFFRMYYILDGKGYISHGEIKHTLLPDKLYLVPNFTNCSYFCDSNLDMIYVIFTNQLYNVIKMYSFFDHVFETDAHKGDKVLIERLLELNPNMGLFDYDPKKYDNWEYLERCKNYEQEKPLKESFESQGILLQLFSRFSPPANDQHKHEDVAFDRVFPIIQYINGNLDKSLSVELLAKKICLSPDYFSRLFLEATKSRPIEYIQRKRIEKAQLLLVTTNFSLEKIAGLTGLNNASYLARLFKRYTGKSPGKYRHSQFL